MKRITIFTALLLMMGVIAVGQSQRITHFKGNELPTTKGIFNKYVLPKVAGISSVGYLVPNSVSKILSINSLNSRGCDTIMASSFESGTCQLVMYGMDEAAPFDSGYISGSNAYGDLEKAMKYTATGNKQISSVYVLFPKKLGTGNVSVKIYAAGANGPGNLLGTSNVITVNNIDTTNFGINFNNKFTFATPVNVSGTYYVSVVLPSFNAGVNELGILCAQHSCSTGESWEKWDDGTWHSFSYSYSVQIDMAIFPEECDVVVNQPPVADFTYTTATVNNVTQFTDASTNSPTSWNWTITPATYTFTGGTSATSQNPKVIFTAQGNYSVTLAATNAYGTGTITKTVGVTSASNLVCDTVMASSFESGTCQLTLYYADSAPFDSGYISGSNAYGDLEKAMKYTAIGNKQISSVYVLFPRKKGTGNVSVKIYAAGSNGPGNLLGTSNIITVPNIDTTNFGINFNNKFTFATPVNVTGTYYVSVVLPNNFQNGVNELGILCAKYSCSTGESWEKWDDNTWHSFSSVYGAQIDMAIFPEVCGNPPVTVTANASSANICSGASTNLSAIASGGDGNYTYAWAPANSLSATNIANPIASPTTNTTYTVTASSDGMSATATVSVTINPLPTVNAGQDVTICQGNYATITATASYATSYIWSDNSTALTLHVNPIITTIYTLSATNSCGTSTDEVTVNVTPLPTINDLGPAQAICPSQTTDLNIGTGNGYTYEWYFGQMQLNETSNILTVAYNNMGSGWYKAIVTANGCSASDSVQITFKPLPSANAGVSTAVCQLDINFTLSTASFSNLDSVIWTTSGNGTFDNDHALQPVYTISNDDIAAGTVTLTATAYNECGNTTSNITLTIVSTPHVDAGQDLTVYCGGGSIQLLATGANTYVWSPASLLDNPNIANPTATVTQTTDFVVEGTSSCGTATDTVRVFVDYNVPVINLTATDDTICTNQTVTLDAGYQYSYLWSTGETTQAINGDASNMIVGTLNWFTVTVSDVHGCTSTDSIAVFMDNCVNVFESTTLANAIYPNPTTGSLTIDLAANNITLTIYNTHGQLLLSRFFENAETRTIDLSGFAKGIYVIKLQSNTATSVSRIVLE